MKTIFSIILFVICFSSFSASAVELKEHELSYKMDEDAAVFVNDKELAIGLVDMEVRIDNFNERLFNKILKKATIKAVKVTRVSRETKDELEEEVEAQFIELCKKSLRKCTVIYLDVGMQTFIPQEHIN